MKFLVPLSVAAALAFACSSGAQAQPTDNSEAGMPPHSVIGSDLRDHPYHPCHGSSSGTAHASCGTLTGGPSGSLF